MKFFILFFFTNAWANSISPDYGMLIKNPLTANVVITGTLIEESNEHYIKTERSWGKAPKKILAPVNYQDGGRIYQSGTLGKKYLLFMTKWNNDFDGPRVMVPLKSSKNIMAIFATKKDFAGDINPAWQFCTEDSECIHAENKCGGTISLNKEYKETYLKFLKTKNHKWNCLKKELIVAEKKCVENFCINTK